MSNGFIAGLVTSLVLGLALYPIVTGASKRKWGAEKGAFRGQLITFLLAWGLSVVLVTAYEHIVLPSAGNDPFTGQRDAVTMPGARR